MKCATKAAFCLLFVACHNVTTPGDVKDSGGEDAGSVAPPPTTQPGANTGTTDNGVHISGTVQNLLGSGLVIAQAGEQLSLLAGAQAFLFQQTRTNGDAYDVAIVTQPSHPNQVCTIASASGTVGPQGASDVAITCVTLAYTLAFQASGHGETVEVAGHSFANTGTLSLDDGTLLDLRVLTHPLGEHCYFLYGGERIDGADLDVQTFCEIKNVQPAYPLNGTEFGDWIENDGSDRTNASDTPCNAGGSARPMSACFPAGQQVVIALDDLASCVGIEATDSLGAQDWACRVVAQHVRIVSLGLKPNVTPSDLIDWSTSPRNWKLNQVTVTQAATSILTTHPARFYHDVLPFGSLLNNEGRVYAVDATHPFVTTGASVAGVAVVFAPDYVLGAANEALNVSAAAPLFWLIGNDLPRGTSAFGLRLNAANARFLRVNHARLQGAGPNPAVSLQNTAGFLLRDVSAMNGPIGFDIGGTSTYGTLHRVVGANNGVGLKVSASIALDDDPRLLIQDAAFFNSTDGALINAQTRITLQNVSVVGAADRGIELLESGKSLFHNISVEKALTTGLVVNDLSGSQLGSNRISSMLVLGGDTGFSVVGGASNRYSHLVSYGSGVGVKLFDAGQNVFSGWLKVGHTTTYTCSVDPPSSTLSGLLNDTCAPSTQSSSVFRHLADAETPTVGEIRRNDTVNTSDTASGGSVGRATYATNMDWLGSEFRFFRGWARATLAGNCSNAVGKTTCVLADLSLRTGDQSDLGANGAAGGGDDGAAALNVLGCPSASDVQTHVWGAARSQTFLGGAVEIIDDGIGNEDGLCESNETCVLSPNIGAYQGSGVLVSADTLATNTPQCPATIAFGGLGGIRLMKFSKNGRACALADHDGVPGTAMESVCE